MQKLQIHSREKQEVKDITEEVKRVIRDAGKLTGVCHIFVLHTTAAVTTADLDPGTDRDMLEAFAAWIPRLEYRHPHDPGHLGDHILSSTLGTSLAIAVNEGEPLLGTWQRIVLVEFDGPRERDVVVSMVPESK